MSSHFNIYDEYKLESFNFNFMGEYVLSNSRFFLSKKNVVFAYDNNEFFFYKDLDNLDNDDFDNLIVPFSNFALDEFITPNETHMSTYVTLFISSNFIDSKLIHTVRKYKKRRSYSFGLKGYSNFRIILFNKNTKEFFFNRDSKDTIKYYKEVLL